MKRIQRKKQVRRNLILLILSTILISSFMIFFTTMSTQASDMEHTPTYKYYKSIYISQGDTLWSIAAENMDSHYDNAREYINEVKHMNALKSDHIVCGTYLIVPYFSTVPSISQH